MNSKGQARRQGVGNKGPWRSHKWLILRRISQLTILGLFLSGPWLGIWVLRGNYSGSLLLDTVPLTDPLTALQSMAAGHALTPLTLLGTGVVLLIYGLAGKRPFCAWVCPVNPVTDLAAALRRRYGLRTSATIPRALRYLLLMMVLAGAGLTGTLIWEWINPVSLLGRSLLMGFGSGAAVLVALFLFDLLVVEHGWCGHLCPLGALYGVIGGYGAIGISAAGRQRCTRCMACFHICPEPQVLRGPVLDPQRPEPITGRDCRSCGRCIDVCPEDVFTITIGWHSGAKS